jgi:hypothetical protein
MNIELITCITSCITLFLTILITFKLYRKHKENYPVDISGGFPPPCNNCGDCVAYGKPPNM